MEGIAADRPAWATALHQSRAKEVRGRPNDRAMGVVRPAPSDLEMIGAVGHRYPLVSTKMLRRHFVASFCLPLSTRHHSFSLASLFFPLVLLLARMGQSSVAVRTRRLELAELAGLLESLLGLVAGLVLGLLPVVHVEACLSVGPRACEEKHAHPWSRRDGRPRPRRGRRGSPCPLRADHQ